MNLETLQAQLQENLNALYRAEPGTVDHSGAVSEYNFILAKIVEIYGGEDKTPAYEDADMYEVFHNCYKSDHGFRPRQEMTIADVNKWLAERRDAA
jgi:hypothetical protein